MLVLHRNKLAFSLSVTGLVVLQGILIGIGLGLPLSIAVIAVACLGVLAIAIWTGNLKDGGIWWVTLVAVALPITYIMTFASRQLAPAADIWLLLVAIVALRRFPGVLAELPVIRWLIALYAAHIGLGVVSTMASTVAWKAAAYQALYNLKLPAILFCGIAIGWGKKREDALRWVLVVIAIAAIAMLAFQLASPAHYRSIAVGSIETSATPNPLLRGLTNRAAGPYAHSGILAINAAFCGAVFYLFYLTKSGSSLLNLSGAFIATIALVLSGQQQEALAYLLTLVILGVFVKTKPSLGVIAKLVAFGLVASTALLLLLGEAQLAKLENQWGVSASVDRLDSARPIFNRDGIELANAAFPLGTGLGSYGSVGAQLFNQSLYTKLGYTSYWWYRQGLFLLDTYWPNIIVESGWFGALTLFAFLLTALVAVASRFWSEQDVSRKRLYGIATAGHLIVLLTSLTSPIYTNPSSSAWLLIWTGIALRSMCQQPPSATHGVGTIAHLEQPIVGPMARWSRT